MDGWMEAWVYNGSMDVQWTYNGHMDNGWMYNGHTMDIGTMDGCTMDRWIYNGHRDNGWMHNGSMDIQWTWIMDYIIFKKQWTISYYMYILYQIPNQWIIYYIINCIINCKHEQATENNRQVLGIEPRFLDCRSSVLTTALQPPVSSCLLMLLVVLLLLYYVNCIFVDGPD
jgi:hypothetical protein